MRSETARRGARKLTVLAVLLVLPVGFKIGFPVLIPTRPSSSP